MSDLKSAIRAQIDGGAWRWDTLIDMTAVIDTATSMADIQHVAQLVCAEQDVHHLPPRGPVVVVVADLRSHIAQSVRRYQIVTTDECHMRISVVDRAEDVDAVFARWHAVT